ncbi:hypothetical protein A3F64_03070 [Candidatus Saccharibacteria bacterium RIFCSPHIGHO2_12_FULL_42_8]|nr:MAG: hypothetical protein A3F64_03070 [Candidatus Saccharibacteria bacterium RIFCSPHIGHO2_12_FULL_42_8]
MEQPQPIEKNDIQVLTDGIDKNSVGWDAVIDYRDLLYRNFFAAGTTDLAFEVDIVELEEFIEKAVIMIAARFEDSAIEISHENIRELLVAGTVHEWEKRIEKVEKNISIGTQAIMNTFRDSDLSKLNSTRQGVEGSD